MEEGAIGLSWCGWWCECMGAKYELQSAAKVGGGRGAGVALAIAAALAVGHGIGGCGRGSSCGYRR